MGRVPRPAAWRASRDGAAVTVPVRRWTGVRALLGIAVALLPLVGVSSVAAQDAVQNPDLLEREYLTGSWRGWRSKVAASGFEPYLVYTGSMWSNLAGGLRTGTEFDGYVDVGFGVDLDKLGLWKGLGLQVSGHWFQGRQPSAELVGVDESQAVNLWEASNAIRVFNLYLTQSFGDDGVLQIGQMAVDSDFMISRYAGTFLNGTFGVLPPQDVNIDAPIYPLAGPGVYASSSLVGGLAGRLGAYTADAGVDVAGNHGFGWQLGNAAGYAFFGELTADVEPAGLPGAWTLGGYYAAVRERKLDASGYVYAQWSGWVMVDQALRVDALGDPVVGVFARFGYSPDDERNVVGLYADAGVNVFGVLPGRPHDVLGFAGSVLELTDDFRRAGSVPVAGEGILELTYQIVVTPWLTVQPDLQYVIDPDANGRDATVAGLELVATF